jgi:O-antigen ligase
MAWRNPRQVLRLPLVKVRVDIFYGLMLAFLLYGDGHSKSTTSCLALVLACGLFFFLEYQRQFLEYQGRRDRQLSPVRFVFGLLLIGLLVSLGVELAFDSSLYVVVAESQGKDATLTGRTDLWYDLFMLGQHHTLFGAGYEGFWNPSMCLYLKELYAWGPRQAHNGYIEIWLNLGFVGLGLFALMVGQAIYGITPLFQKDFEYGRFRLIVLLITLLHNYSEAGFPRTTHLVWLVFLLVAINVKPTQASSAKNMPAPAAVARPLGQPKAIHVRPGPYTRHAWTMQSRSPKLDTEAVSSQATEE